MENDETCKLNCFFFQFAIFIFYFFARKGFSTCLRRYGRHCFGRSAGIHYAGSLCRALQPCWFLIGQNHQEYAIQVKINSHSKFKMTPFHDMTDIQMLESRVVFFHCMHNCTKCIEAHCVCIGHFYCQSVGQCSRSINLSSTFRSVLLVFSIVGSCAMQNANRMNIRLHPVRTTTNHQSLELVWL